MQHSIAWLLSDIRAPFDAPEEEILQIARTKMKRARIPTAGLHFRIYKKSLDARRRSAIVQVCSVLAECADAVRITERETQGLRAIGARAFTEQQPEIPHGNEPLLQRPLVVGMGPAGLFAALMLAEQGYAPIIIDRGDDVDARAAVAEGFRTLGVLDTESNIQFGAAVCWPTVWTAP